MYKYKITGQRRQIGAIGIPKRFSAIVYAESKNHIRDNLVYMYQEYEHIHVMSTKQLEWLPIYKLELTLDEIKSLAVVAAWYESPEILLNAIYKSDSDNEQEYLIPEHKIWEYIEAIPHDWSYSNPDECPQIIPPCIGGTLGDKLADLYERIV